MSSLSFGALNLSSSSPMATSNQNDLPIDLSLPKTNTVRRQCSTPLTATDLSITGCSSSLSLSSSASSYSTARSAIGSYTSGRDSRSSPFAAGTSATLLSPPNSIEGDDPEHASNEQQIQHRRRLRLAQRVRMAGSNSHHLHQPPTIVTAHRHMAEEWSIAATSASTSATSHRPSPYHFNRDPLYTPLLTIARPHRSSTYSRRSPSPASGALVSDGPAEQPEPAHQQSRRPLTSALSYAIPHQSKHQIPFNGRLVTPSVLPTQPATHGPLAHSFVESFVQRHTIRSTQTVINNVLSPSSSYIDSIRTQATAQPRQMPLNEPQQLLKAAQQPSTVNFQSAAQTTLESLIAEQVKRAQAAAAQFVRSQLKNHALSAIQIPTTPVDSGIRSNPLQTNRLTSLFNPNLLPHESCVSPSDSLSSSPFLESNVHHMIGRRDSAAALKAHTNQPTYERERSPLPNTSRSTSSPDTSSICSDSGESSEFDHHHRRRCSSRPLTGRHVRVGTGASASTLASLRKLLTKRIKGKQSPCQPGGSVATVPMVTLVN